MKRILLPIALLVTMIAGVALHAGDLKVNLSPQQAVKAGARWSVDGGVWKTSGTTVKKLSNGTHQVTFKPVNGWLTPAPVSIVIGNGTTTLNQTYQMPAALSINLTPGSGQWRIDGGAWLASGATATEQTPGSHWVEYSSLAGYAPLPAETVLLTGGQTTTLNRNYAALASFSVTLDPSSAEWRLDGGTWNASGALLTDLSLGDHTVDFGEVDGYITPDPVTVTLVSGANPPLSVTYEQPPFVVLHRFENYGGFPITILGSDGAVYCATTKGGVDIEGQVFRINPDGTGFQRLVYLNGETYSSGPPSALVEGSDGILYGATRNSSSGLFPPVSSKFATIFRVNKDGAGYAVMASPLIVGNPNPNSLIEGTDGVLYGTMDSGYSQTGGLVFKIARDGNQVQTVRQLTVGEGKDPVGLVETASGVLIGVARTGGANGKGTIFKINKDGSGFAVLKHFAGGPDGEEPRAKLLLGSDGLLYGSTYFGGPTVISSMGMIFRINEDGTGYTVLHNFTGASGDGRGPESALAEDPVTGRLHGFTPNGGVMDQGALFSLSKDGSGYSLLRSFGYSTPEGANPRQPPIFLADGTILGSTTSSITSSPGFASPLGVDSGRLFRLNPNGTTLSGIMTFGAPLGAGPQGAVVLASNGYLYGATVAGGSKGFGTVYRVQPDGSNFELVHSLSAVNEGANPSGGMIEASNGQLFGTSPAGNGYGTLFRVNPVDSTFQTIRSFSDPATGTSLRAGVTEGSDGMLYGTTHSGGSGGQGTVFRIGADGSGFQVLWHFSGGSGGGRPSTRVIEGVDGRLYGTTNLGGINSIGIVYALNKDGTGFTVLHEFQAVVFDANPRNSELLEASDGLLYGTTYTNSIFGTAGVFRMQADGSNYEVVHNFSGDITIVTPSGLTNVVELDGKLYGAATDGGVFNKGSLFRMNRDGSGFEVLVNFGAGDDDATLPTSISLGSDGLIYGTATGDFDAGAVFRFDPN